MDFKNEICFITGSISLYIQLSNIHNQMKEQFGKIIPDLV